MNKNLAGLVRTNGEKKNFLLLSLRVRVTKIVLILYIQEMIYSIPELVKLSKSFVYLQ